MSQHLTRHVSRTYSSTPTDTTADHTPSIRFDFTLSTGGSQCEWKVTRIALDRALSRMEAHTTQGLEAIPTGLVKSIGDVVRGTVASIFSGILSGDPVPSDWHCGRVTLVPEKGDDAGPLRDYWALTVTTVLYRLSAHILKRWMSAWAENTGALTELQNVFQPTERLEDNLFVLIQTIEIARKESRGLVGCFLDVAKAYNSIHHEPLFNRMVDLDMQTVWVDLLRRLYSNNSVVVCFGGARSEPVPVDRDLKQGRPPSPLLYAMYDAGLERTLLESGLAFPLRD